MFKQLFRSKHASRHSNINDANRSFVSSAATMVTILFDLSKNELFKLTDNYKTVNRKLKANYKTEV